MKSTTARVLSLAIFLLAQQKSVLSQEFEIKVPTLSVAGPGDSQASEKEAAPVASRDTPFVETPEAGGLLVMALLGSAMAVMSHVAPAFAAESSNSRIDYDTPAVTYAKNVAAFEHKVEKRIKNGVASVRQSARKASRYLRNGIKDTAGRSFGVVRSGASGIARIADRGMRTFARATTNGLRRLGGATTYGVGRVGNGAGSGIARVGTAARRGISRMTDAYRRSLSRAGLGIIGVGSAATRRMANVGRTYLRGISRLGSAATSRIGQASSVSRMGELAAEGASKVAEVATAVPQSISSLAADKKLQDCLMQTMCYVSSPFLTGDRTQRKRMLRSLANLSGSEGDASATLDDDEAVTLLHTRQENNGIESDDERDVKLDDCDVFKCEIASLGRKAYGLVSELREASRRR